MTACNLVLIMTDTQTRRMVGAYGLAPAGTPQLDALAADGIRCDNAYTTSPLCTPARSAIFSGLYPSSNGAWCNNQAPAQDVALMGEIFARAGWRAGYTGKWHLDGGGYYGDGVAAGGFEEPWWYDGRRYARDLGPAAFAAFRDGDAQARRAQGLDREELLWGRRVADRAIDFLRSLRADERFCLVVSFDEPHGPHLHPTPPSEPDEDAAIREVGPTPAHGHVPEREPELHRRQRAEIAASGDWERDKARFAQIWACNRWVDSQIGRVLAEVRARTRDDTAIIYTTDHGEQQLEHGLLSKGPMCYEESVHIPLLARLPGQRGGRVCAAPVSHLDLLPTMLDLAGLDIPPRLQGVSQAPVWRGEAASARAAVHCEFTRFAVNHQGWGGFYPLRAVIADGWKLVIHLDDDDQLFDLNTDPHELRNRIGDADCAPVRERLHDLLLAEQERCRDPFRGRRWAERPWRDRAEPTPYFGGQRSDKPRGFAWQESPLEATD